MMVLRINSVSCQLIKNELAVNRSSNVLIHSLNTDAKTVYATAVQAIRIHPFLGFE